MVNESELEYLWRVVTSLLSREGASVILVGHETDGLPENIKKQIDPSSSEALTELHLDGPVQEEKLVVGVMRLLMVVLIVGRLSSFGKEPPVDEAYKSLVRRYESMLW